MTAWLFVLLVWLGSLAGGFLGSMTGLGGGFIIVPFLTFALGVDIRYAIGASLVSVIATSSGAAASYVRQGFTNIRVGMLLEVATTVGALVGAFVAAYVSSATIAVVFGLVLLFSVYLQLARRLKDPPAAEPDRLAQSLRLDSSYPTPSGPRSYHVRAVPWGSSLMLGAGVLSGLLGIGSGALKVLAMDEVMRIPFKVSISTSNFMIGVTAAASAGVYFSRGYIHPAIAMPVMLGALMGSLTGARLLHGTNVRLLRVGFSLILLLLAAEMIFNGLTGRI